MFLTARILSLIVSLAWLGLILYALKQLQRVSGFLRVSMDVVLWEYRGQLIIFGGICLVHMLFSIYVQQRKKWAVACLFVMTTLEIGFNIIYFFVAYFDHASAYAYLVLTLCILTLGALLWSLTESYKAITNEKYAPVVGFQPVMKPQAVEPENKP